MSRRRLGAVLRACVTHPDRALPAALAPLLRDPAPARLLATASAYHRVSGFVRPVAAATPGAHPRLAAALDRAQAGAVGRHLGALVELPVVRRVLDGAGIPWLVMKGPVLAETVYPTVDLRPYQDLDVLVPGERLREAIEGLEDAGAELIDRNWALFVEREVGEVHLVLPSGSLCDLHWHVLHDRHERAAFRLPTRDLLERSRRVALGGLEVPTLDPVDTLHHLAVHACLSGAERLIWLEDVTLVLRVLRPDLDELVARCRAAGTGLLAAVVLARARRVLGAPVPAEVVRALDPGGAWTRLVAAADRIAPPEQVTGQGSLPRLVARATRHGLRSSLGRAARHAASWALATCHPGRGRWEGGGSTTDPGSARYPAGGNAAYRTYLAVAGAAVAGERDRDGSQAGTPRRA